MVDDQSLLIVGLILFVVGLSLVFYVLCKWSRSCCYKNDTQLLTVELSEPENYSEFHDHLKNMAYQRLCEKLKNYPKNTHDQFFKAFEKRFESDLSKFDQPLHQATDLVKKAIEEDKNGNYVNAVKLYDESVAIFTHLANDVLISEKAKSEVREKCSLYADRAEVLREYSKGNQEAGCLLQQAIDLMIKATENDKNHQYQEALTQYDEGLTIFSNLVNNGGLSESAKNSVRTKSYEYSARAEKLREFLKTGGTEIGTISLQQAVDLLTKATEEDKNRNYREALRLYEEGLAVFSRIMNSNDVVAKIKDRVRTKYEEYDKRVDKIRKYLEKNENEAKESLQGGIDLISKAAEADQNENFLKALRLYQEGFEFFSHAMNINDVSPQTINSVLNKHDESEERIGNLTKYLIENPPLASSNQLNDVMQKAIEEDGKRNYAEAAQLYEKGFDIYSYLKENETKLTVRMKFEEYVEAVDERIRKNFEEKHLSVTHDTFQLHHIRVLSVNGTKEEQNENYEEALNLYNKARENCSELIDDETLAEIERNVIRTKYEYFDNRVKIVEDILKTGENSKKDGNKAGNEI